MINHYFDLQIRVSAERELTSEEERLIEKSIRTIALDSNFGSRVRVNALANQNVVQSQLVLPQVLLIEVGDVALAWRSDENDEEI